MPLFARPIYFLGKQKIVVPPQLKAPHDYVLEDIVIEHVDEVFKLMAALTGDYRYEQAVNEISDEKKKEGVVMCEVLDKLVARGEAIGEARGEARGKAQGEAIGEARLSELLIKLQEAGRLDDLNKALTDIEHRKKLYAEFGLKKKGEGVAYGYENRKDVYRGK